MRGLFYFELLDAACTALATCGGRSNTQARLSQNDANIAFLPKFKTINIIAKEKEKKKKKRRNGKEGKGKGGKGRKRKEKEEIKGGKERVIKNLCVHFINK